MPDKPANIEYEVKVTGEENLAKVEQGTKKVTQSQKELNKQARLNTKAFKEFNAAMYLCDVGLGHFTKNVGRLLFTHIPLIAGLGAIGIAMGVVGGVISSNNEKVVKQNQHWSDMASTIVGVRDEIEKLTDIQLQYGDALKDLNVDLSQTIEYLEELNIAADATKHLADMPNRIEQLAVSAEVAAYGKEGYKELMEKRDEDAQLQAIVDSTKTAMSNKYGWNVFDDFFEHNDIGKWVGGLNLPFFGKVYKKAIPEDVLAKYGVTPETTMDEYIGGWRSQTNEFLQDTLATQGANFNEQSQYFKKWNHVIQSMKDAGMGPRELRDFFESTPEDMHARELILNKQLDDIQAGNKIGKLSPLLRDAEAGAILIRQLNRNKGYNEKISSDEVNKILNNASETTKASNAVKGMAYASSTSYEIESNHTSNQTGAQTTINNENNNITNNYYINNSSPQSLSQYSTFSPAPPTSAGGKGGRMMFDNYVGNYTRKL